MIRLSVRCPWGEVLLELLALNEQIRQISIRITYTVASIGFLLETLIGTYFWGEIDAQGATDPNGAPNGSTIKHHQIVSDGLGSAQVTVDHTGARENRVYYDPWGARTRVADGGGQGADPGTFALSRGFTMHEHFDESGFIHMNGRTYDPSLGRMMQADPFVQVPTNLQNYNRYSYVLNAPLAYTDPSGYKKIWNQSWFRQVAVMAVAVYTGVYVSGLYEGYAASTMLAGGTPIAIGGSVSATSGLIAGTVVGALSGNTMLGASVGCMIATSGMGTPACVAGFTAIHQASMGANGGAIVRSAMVAFVQTALLQGIGNEFGGAVNTAADAGTLLSTPEYYAKIISHAVVGCISGAASGGECESGAISGGIGAATSPWLPDERAAGGGVDWSKAGPNLVITSIMGGIGSELSGGSFSDGARTAGWGYLFNQLGGRGNRGQGPKQPGWGYEYPEVDHPFAPNDEFKARFFGSEEERRVWFRTQEIAAGRAESREWLRFDDPKVQLPRSGGPLYQIFDLGLAEAGALRIAYSPKIPNVFYVSLDHYQPTPAQPLRWTRFEAAPPKN